MEIPFNVNWNVKVKLNDRGRAILKENHEKLFADYPKEKYPYREPEENEGWTRWQLWHLMQEFGPHMSVGFDPPFETTILLLTED